MVEQGIMTATAVSSSPAPLHCDRLLDADGCTLGFFSSGTALRCARASWQLAGRQVRSVSTYLGLLDLDSEVVEAGDGDRVEYLLAAKHTVLGARVAAWLAAGASVVEVSQIEMNGWCCPAGEYHSGQSQAITYRLLIKARQ